MSGRRVEPLHWARRLVGSVRRGDPSALDRAWAMESMSEAEGALFDAMDGRDQVHSIVVARRVAASNPERVVIAAALLHDVGKSVAGFGVPGRVAATALGVVGGERLARRWSGADGWRRRMSDHLDYPELGRRLLVDAGSDHLVSAWAAEHHRPPESWTVPADLAGPLAAADR